jgi:glycosyltransferase involved in cell wall biosynthesis
MNIGIVTTWFERGAAYVSRQFEHVLSENNEIYIYARGGENYARGNPTWDKENVTWGKRNMLSSPTQINLSHLKKWIKTNSIDIILFNEQHDWKPVVALTEMNVKTGAYIDYYKKETVPFFEIYDFLICNTKRHYSVFDWHPQAYYVPWGTNTELYAPGKHSFDENRLSFFHSSGMNPYRKGTDFLLEAFEHIDRKESRLIIHSQVDIKAFFPEKTKLIEKFLKEGSLELILKTIGSPGLYYLGDVYVYPSRLEGIGLTIAEAISSGLPAIVPDQQPMNEFIQSSDAGRLVKISYTEKRRDNYYWPQSIVDIDDLIEQMQFYLKNKAQIHAYKKNARKYAKKNLDWHTNLNAFEPRLKELKKSGNDKKEDLCLAAVNYDKNQPLKQKIKQTLAYRKLRMRIKQ